MVVGTGQDGKNFLESSSCRPHELKSEESASVDASTTFNITLGCLAKILVVDASVIKWPQVTDERLFLCIRCVLKGEFLPLIIGTKSMQREPRGVAATRGGRDREALLSISSYPSLTVCFPRNGGLLSRDKLCQDTNIEKAVDGLVSPRPTVYLAFNKLRLSSGITAGSQHQCPALGLRSRLCTRSGNLQARFCTWLLPYVSPKSWMLAPDLNRWRY